MTETNNSISNLNNNEEKENEEENLIENTSKYNLNDNENNVYEICQLFDKENNETIDSNDLIDLIKALGIMLTEENIEIIKDFISKNKKEKIPFKEFFDLYDNLMINKKSKEEEEKELISAFEFFDGENTGYIDVNYFKKAICSFGNKLNENEFNELMGKAIFDKTNKSFNYKEFIKTILDEDNI